MSALPPKADMCDAENKCPLSANNIQGLLGSSLEFRGNNSAGQDNPDFGELAELCIDLDRARSCLTIMSWLMERPRPVSSFIIAGKKNSRDDSEGLFRGLEPI